MPGTNKTNFPPIKIKSKKKKSSRRKYTLYNIVHQLFINQTFYITNTLYLVIIDILNFGLSYVLRTALKCTVCYEWLISQIIIIIT